MDNRAKQELKEGLGRGIKIAGMNGYKLLNSIRISGAVAASVKDPVWKYNKWVERNEPDNFRKVYKWLDVKEYLILKTTGEFIMTEDSAFATLLYDTRPDRRGFSDKLCAMLGVDRQHLPKVVNCTDQVGRITPQAAAELGLEAGIPVFGGGGDASVGAGADQEGSTHIYLGTSGWVSTVVRRQVLDTKNMIAAIIGAHPPAERKVKASSKVRLVGGGALAPLTCQILADVLGREIETVPHPQNSGAVEAAIVAAVGLGLLPDLTAAVQMVPVKDRYLPKPEHTAIYDRLFPVFKSLYYNNRKAFSLLNG